MNFKTARDYSVIQLLSLFLIAYFLFAGNAFAQTNLVTISGTLLSESDKEPIPFSNVILKAGGDSAFVAGTISKENGQFILSRIKPGNYILHSSSIGFKPITQAIFVGSASEYLNLGNIILSPSSKTLSEVEVSGGNDLPFRLSKICPESQLKTEKSSYAEMIKLPFSWMADKQP